MESVKKCRLTPFGLNRIPLVVTEPDGTQTSKFIEITVDAGDSKLYTYDANGNLLSVALTSAPTNPLQSYEWDAKNRIAAIEWVDEATSLLAREEFGYNERDERVESKRYLDGVLETHQRFVWDGARIRQQRDSTGNVVERSVTPTGEKTIGSPEEFRFILSDHLGSTRTVIDNLGTLMTAASYSPFGEMTIESGTKSVTAGYTGHFLHDGTGVFLAKYRGYDAKVGRWLSTDPLGEEVNEVGNLFNYVGSNPINYWDPLGLRPWKDQRLAALAAAEAVYKATEKDSKGREYASNVYQQGDSFDFTDPYPGSDPVYHPDGSFHQAGFDYDSSKSPRYTMDVEIVHSHNVPGAEAYSQRPSAKDRLLAEGQEKIVTFVDHEGIVRRYYPRSMEKSGPNIVRLREHHPDRTKEIGKIPCK